MCEPPIARDTLIITDAESVVKWRVPKILLEYFMRQLQNDIIASIDNGGLIGARNTNTNYVIISDTMFRFLAPLQLLPMTNNYKMRCGCDICKTSKYFKESLNTWQWKQSKTMKDKTDNSRGRRKYKLTQYYKSYADYAFPSKISDQNEVNDIKDLLQCSMSSAYCKKSLLQDVDI